MGPQKSALGELKRENEGIWEFLTEDSSVVRKPIVFLYPPPLQVRRFVILSLCPFTLLYSTFNLILAQTDVRLGHLR